MNGPAARAIAADPAADAWFMALALTLGRRGLGNTWPNPAVGAVVVGHGIAGARIVGRGWTQRGGRPHAEIEALGRAAGQALGATLYVTLEPCSHHGRSPPCADAIIAAGIERVVSALEDPNPRVAGQGHARLARHGVYVETGIGCEAALLAHAGHIRRVRDGRPHITLKLAASADGKAGLSGRRPIAITGDAARDRVHLLRAMNDAILIGIGTALADDPMLTCRLPGMASHSPVRVVLDCQLRLPPAGRLGRSASETPVWVVAGQAASAEKEAALVEQSVEVIRANETAPGRLDLAAVTNLIAARGITRLMVEGGPTIAASFIGADLVDEATLFRSQRVVGPDGIDALEGLPLSALTGSPRLMSLGVEAVGPDLVETFVRA